MHQAEFFEIEIQGILNSQISNCNNQICCFQHVTTHSGKLLNDLGITKNSNHQSISKDYQFQSLELFSSINIMIYISQLSQ